ncbi:MAG: ATP-grasp domain-containing protein [Eubacteriales bacterium]
MNHTLLIVSGGIEAVPGIIRAKEMGLYVVVSDYNPGAPGFAYADDCILASTYDVDATVAAAEKYHRTVRTINGVICVASDVPLTVATVAERLGIPGIPVAAARLASDKLAMKKRFVEQDLPVPWFGPVESVEHLKAIVDKRGLPLVIKPVDSRGARGVLRLVEGIDLAWVFAEAKKNSPTGRVMVEEFIAGPQISTEAILLNGKDYTLGFSDRNYEFLDRFAPYIIENGGTQPSILSEDDRRAVSELAVQAGTALGVKTGVVKGDMVLGEKGPMVIEVAARLSGGWFSTDQIPLHTGVDFVGKAIKLALGEPVNPEELIPNFKRGVAIRYFFPPLGRIEKLPDITQLNQMPGVYKVLLFVHLGEVLMPVTNHTQRAGCVITVGDTRDEAVARALDVVVRAETEFIVTQGL